MNGMKISMKAARVNAGLTQEEAARHLKLSKGTIASYENQKTRPSVEMAKQIAKLYGVAFDDISFCEKVVL